MRPSERRAAQRVDIDINATLVVGASRSPCRLRNMCEKGFLIEAEDSLPVGGHIELVVPFPPGEPIHCTVQIRHVNKGRLGALVTGIGDEERGRCLAYLAERRAASPAAASTPAPLP
ncbi:MAG TPA: PilZ domain-containing protein [Burkholderiales bacterium]|nr:PilZ domain-containing protein [Burkholderiales bacterium]